LSQAISAAFASEYRMRAAELHKWADLAKSLFLRQQRRESGTPLTGNLSYYVGARIAESGYIRNRDLEFTESRRPPKAEVLRKFDDAIALVTATIERQSESDWTLPYSGEREPEAKNRFTLFLRCGSHLYRHVGQIIDLSRELTKS
jgi:hypothetical protein